ncbi:Imm27 family immunity protein [Mucilaginibacter defluvii]|uniref:DUF1579 domain-containing protein n=1 Tax=Mucilaginibacter defluvii TaxID=1196019 RepID=A0ABP9G721_9SPHI
MKLLPEETLIIGDWIFRDRKMIGDDNCERIEWLAKNYLKAVGAEDGNWTTIYQDPNDKRYWRHTYPKFEMQGGGPPLLENIGSVFLTAEHKSVEINIQKYIILETGNDGGHRYIEGKVFYKGNTRRITVFFESKLDEAKLTINTPIKIQGEFQDDGEAYGLILRHALLM